jgi:twitching motility protein PilT
MGMTVDSLVGQLEEQHLVSARDLATVRARWFRPSRKEVNDATRFGEWLRVNAYLTDFVLAALTRGRADRLVLNQYRLTEQLRSGPEAGDFLATDPVDHVVRVQILSPALAGDAAWFGRFRQLVQRLMKIQHPAVARVLDLGQAAGVDYLVSEHVEGETLEEVLKKRGKLPHLLAARILAVAADAVHALHHGGVPAGELTADCLVFAAVERSASANKMVRLVNAALPRRLFDSSALGITGEGPSTPGPRAAADGLTTPDGAPRAEDDVFRLGALLYRCLTGRAPFPADEAARGGGARQPVRQLAPDVPELLAELVDRMIDPVPANRPRHAAGVAKAVRILLKADEEDRPASIEEALAVAVPAPAHAAEEPEAPPGEAAEPASADAATRMAELSVPPGVPGEPEVNRLFRAVMSHDASDLHLAAGCQPMMRHRGEIRRMDLPVLSQPDMERLMEPILNDRSRRLMEETGGADFAHIVGGGEARFRVNLFRQQGHLSLVARRVNAKVPTFEKLGLPPVMSRLCQWDQGLIILAGVTGSGKSTTLAAMLDYINEREQVHILTIEDPIEYLFKGKKAVINQREVGIDVRDWQVALKHAVRQDPDVILIGEMRDRDTFEAGLNAAETGHLVFGTIHASSAPSTIGRILDLFPADMHAAMRQSLAFNLKAIVCQKLLPSIKPGVQRVPANEIMIVNPTIRDLIVKGEDKKLPDAIRIGMVEGMLDFNESLRLLVTRGDVDQHAALEVSPNADALKMALKGIKVAQPGIL